MIEVATLLIGVIAGILSALFGIGGAIIAIPLLHVMQSVSVQESIGASSFLVVFTAASGAYTYSKKGLVNRKIALAAGLSGVVFSIMGAVLAAGARSSVLVYCVAGVTILFSAFAFFGESIKHHHWSKKAQGHKLGAGALGAFTGLINGVTGIGGGAVLTTMLGSVFGLSVHAAVATAHASILLYAVPGALTHFALGNVSLQTTLPLILGGILGSQLGIRLSLRLHPERLRKYTSAFFFLLGLWLALWEYFNGGF